MKWQIECIFCNNYAYRLKDGRVKCSVCHRKISIVKINKTITLMQTFINNENALHVSKRLNLSYVSVKKFYDEFRYISAKVCEDEYEINRKDACEYEEYFYLENSKKEKKEAIFDAHNFLTFDYDGHIYTLLMPSLQKYKNQFLDDNVKESHIAEFNKFKRISRIIKVSSIHNNIVKFWNYFEKEILKYKGISNDNFALYLKEIEFKYNHTKNDAIDILIQEYFDE
jgi:transposase-like protein